MYERLELYIETLTGAAFELKVSPYETIQDVKARIQKLEGIPISQQHLIWQSIELEDDNCLSDYSIHDGATLKLVLTMRGGPINTRRIPMDDPTLREMAEYFSEANKDEFLEKVSNRPVTVIVYHNGDQLNFFRVVDRDSTSPMSESLSGASMYNLYDEEEDDDGPTREKLDENDKTREKMKLLKMKMENMSITKKPKTVPRPPSSGRPSSKTRYRRLPSNSGSKKSASLNRNRCLPPLGKTLMDSSQSLDILSPVLGASSNLKSAKELFQNATMASQSSDNIDPANIPLGLRRLESVESGKLKQPLSSVKEHTTAEESEKENNIPDASTSSKIQTAPCDKTDPSNKETPNNPLSKEAILRRAQSSLRASRKWDFSSELLLKEPKPPSAPRRKDPSPSPSIEAFKDTLNARPSTSSTKGLERLLESAAAEFEASSGPGRPISQAHNIPSSRPDYRLKDTLSRAPSSSKYSEQRRPVGGVMLESLNPSEVTGMLSSLVCSASRSRTGYHSGGSYKDGRIATPDGRLVSGRLRLSAGREGRMSPGHRLPPVKQKKKSKRCFVCGKKTGLTNSYLCRCSHNFCATHRYAEAHSCTFDYKTEGRKILEQANPVVSAPKLPKI